MIVDCHTHIQSSVEDIDRSEHLAAAETVDACIVLADEDRSANHINKELSEYVNNHKSKMVGFAFIEPTEKVVQREELVFIRDELGLNGVVLYCSSCGFHPAHSRAMQFYESAQQVGMPVFFHNDADCGTAVLNYTQPWLLDEVARTFGDLKLVIGNMGMPFVKQTLTMLRKHKNVYADLTLKTDSIWQVYNTVISAYEYSVMDKLLFGSGFPSGNPGQCIETLLGFNKLLADTNLPRVPREKVRQIVERDTLDLLGINL